MEVSGVILAGGQSSRMGRDKALIKIADQVLLQRVCEVALGVTDRVKIITPWPHRYRAIAPAAVDFLTEQRPAIAAAAGQNHLCPAGGIGPVGGLLQGLQASQTEWILAIACDLPCLQAATLCRWRDQLESLSPQTVAYLPRRDGRWEPLCGFYRASCTKSLSAFIATGGRSLQGWLGSEPVQAIPGINPEELFNLNRPSDLDTLTASLSSRP
ncbi:molybdenum cofactor guanylyltransferase [filamentous cyanobacterium CCP5]|nr:molybdenum cofactor guanylyltransferase [filamentous cyanobacterium CCP5]